MNDSLLEDAGSLKGRPLSLLACFACGLATIVALSIQFYATQGCAAARKAASRFNGRQVSDQMCCPVGRIISAIGLSLTALLGLLGVHKVTRELDAALGQCCCCTRRAIGVGGAAAITFRVTCVGLLLIGIFDMCWLAVMHALGALFFFGAGYLLIGLLCFSRRPDGRLSIFAAGSEPSFKPVLPVLAVAALLVTRLDTLTAEWIAIAAIILASLSLELDIRRGETQLDNEGDNGFDDVLGASSRAPQSRLDAM